MLQIAVKVVITSILVVAISEAGKRSALLGAVLASLPLTSILAMLWLYSDTGDVDKVASLATGIFWLVLPSLILFVTLPVLLHRGVDFGASIAIASAMTVAGYFVMLAILARFGIRL